MTPDLSNRYGNLKRGYLDIVQHPWFQSTDFDQLSKRTITAPYVPPVKSEGDSSNFDTYDESTKPYGISEPDPYRKLFMDF
jgi:protein kinase A